MPEFEISWQAFGVFTVEAENEADAIEELHDEFFGIDWDGLDYTLSEGY